jgi:hypothetical protein
MRTGTKIFLFTIILPALAFFLIYFIAKTSKCDPDCQDKKCGQSDGCSGKCKTCPTGQTCDGTSCQQVTPGGKTKGICYFDIDGTLTTAKGDRDAMMQECLDNNFAIGIITASGRLVEQICNGDKAHKDQSWMSDLLCKQFHKNNAKMYNSTVVVAGKTTFPPGYKAIQNNSQGYVKGWDMKYGRDLVDKNIPDKCVVLFDDQQHVLSDVKKFDKNLEVQCAGNPTAPGACRTLGHVLDIDTVKKKIKDMQSNGCI